MDDVKKLAALHIETEAKLTEAQLELRITTDQLTHYKAEAARLGKLLRDAQSTNDALRQDLKRELTETDRLRDEVESLQARLSDTETHG